MLLVSTCSFLALDDKLTDEKSGSLLCICSAALFMGDLHENSWITFNSMCTSIFACLNVSRVQGCVALSTSSQAHSAFWLQKVKLLMHFSLLGRAVSLYLLHTRSAAAAAAPFTYPPPPPLAPLIAILVQLYRSHLTKSIHDVGWLSNFLIEPRPGSPSK